MEEVGELEPLDIKLELDLLVEEEDDFNITLDELDEKEAL